MLIGFAITQHCNLRCPHCIRDDVTTVQSLSVPLIRSILEQASGIFADLRVSLTGGEPLLHPGFPEMVDLFAELGLSYRFVSNGWHMRRVMPVLDRYPAQHVRLSLSGASQASHDAVRGRGSFHRVLQAVALLTSRRIPTSFSMVIDRTSRLELRDAVDLAEGLGVIGISFILPQPSTGSLDLDSEVPPSEWLALRGEVEALGAEPGRRTAVGMDYGAPFEGPERSCGTFALERIYVDAWGRLATCCQLSDYGFNQTEVVADLNAVPFAEAYETYRLRLARLQEESRPQGVDGIDPFPCMRCVKASGKLEWMKAYPNSGWGRLLLGEARQRMLPVLR
jgi:MoaA/NifB/PqqE/SkfB family radical SAM enzyme